MQKYISMSSIPNRLNLILFISTLFLSLMVKFTPPIWMGYADPYDYLHQSSVSLLSKDFYFPQKNDNFYPRPFTVPLCYKIANSDPDTIIQLQKFLHSLSTFFLCYVILLLLKETYSKIIFIILWYLLMSWWNILGWTHTLLSESLSISFMFFWIASFLLYFSRKRPIYLILHIILTILFSFTRDSWPYILVMFYALFVIIAIRWEKKLLLGSVSFLMLSVSIFIVQQHSAQVGQRYRLPIMNNIVFRILPNEEYVNWFADRGMPCIDSLKEKYSNLDNWQKIYPLYDDSTFTEFSDWVVKDGKSVYTRFLITHPSNLLMLNEKPANLKRIFAYNIGYTGSVTGYSWASQYIFPFFNLLTLLLLNGFLIYQFIKEKRLIWIFPTVLILIFASNAVLLYIADSIEVERHLFITNIFMQFTGILLITFIADSELCNRSISKLMNKIRFSKKLG
jgi:hypothetical protein